MVQDRMQRAKAWMRPGPEGQLPLLHLHQIVTAALLLGALPVAAAVQPAVVPPLAACVAVGFAQTFVPLIRRVSWVIRALLMLLPFAAVLTQQSHPIRLQLGWSLMTGAAVGAVLLAPSFLRVRTLFHVDILSLMGPLDGKTAGLQVTFSLLGIVGEELFFRAYLAPASALVVGTPAAIVINGLLFSGVHALNRQAWASLTKLDYLVLCLMGVVSAWAYLTGQSLLWAIAAHMIYNMPVVFHPVAIWICNRNNREEM